MCVCGHCCCVCMCVCSYSYFCLLPPQHYSFSIPMISFILLFSSFPGSQTHSKYPKKCIITNTSRVYTSVIEIDTHARTHTDTHTHYDTSNTHTNTNSHTHTHTRRHTPHTTPMHTHTIMQTHTVHIQRRAHTHPPTHTHAPVGSTVNDNFKNFNLIFFKCHHMNLKI